MTAATISMTSIFSSTLSSTSHGARPNHLLPKTHLRHLSRDINSLRVRATSEEEPSKAEVTPPTSVPPPFPAAVKAKPVTPKMSTKFGDVFAFSGPAPERINGRLAMLGFVTALAVEVGRGQDLFSQISDGGVSWFIGTSVLFSVASLIPLFSGVSVESKSDGVMTSDAELWNGRFAMLGLVALAFTEFVKGGTLV